MLHRESVQTALETNDRILSRTVKENRLDASVSSKKSTKLASDGPSLSEITRRNRLRVTEYIMWRGELSKPSSGDLFSYLIAIAELTNLGLPSAGLYRTWDVPYWTERSVAIAPSDIDAMLRATLHAISAELQSSDPLECFAGIARAEWEIGIGPLHPFQDGCGRTSRYFAALLAAIFRQQVVAHQTRDAYYMAGAKGLVAFQGYYLGLSKMSIRKAGRPG